MVCGGAIRNYTTGLHVEDCQFAQLNFAEVCEDRQGDETVLLHLPFTVVERKL